VGDLIEYSDELDNRKYEERIICYFDILGWKEKIKATENDDLKVKEMYDYYSYFINSFKEIENNKRTYPTIKVNIVSDSFFISWSIMYRELTMTILNILKFQIQKMLMNDLLVRGGIFKGKLIHEKEILFGPALNKAYELENKCSKYPRIIFNDDIKSEFFHDYRGEESDPFNRYSRCLKQDTDCFYYLDYLAFHKNTLIEENIDQKAFYSKLKHVILEGLKCSDPSIKMKYEWLKVKFNVAVEENVTVVDLKESYFIQG